MLNVGDTIYQTKTYSANSIHNLKSNIGFERILNSGFTFGFNYENFQGFDENSVYEHSLYLKLSHIRDEGTQTNLDYNPLKDNLVFNYNHELNGFDIAVKSNYEFLEEDHFGALLTISNKF